jgi:adenylyltransferase/sulfurtransferase
MLSEQERDRYRRQILLFGEEGQKRLKDAKIFIAGAGGLGSPVAIYLAVAGVGTITIVDRDTVDTSNLNRQILHPDRAISGKKVDSAAETLRELNPDITVFGIDADIGKENVRDLVGDADLIVDAMDNYPARFLLNETALGKGIPLIHGAIRGFHGQATTILPGKTPCLRCIFPHVPPGEVFPALGVTAGVIGTIQANEVVKYVVGTGTLLAGRLLLWDGLRSSLEEIAVDKNPRCPVCSGTGTGKPGTKT